MVIFEDAPTSSRGDDAEPAAVVRERLLVRADVAQVRKALESAAQSMGMMGTSRRGGTVFLLAAGEDTAVSVELAQDTTGTRVIVTRPADDPDGVAAMRAERVRRVLQSLGAGSATSASSPLAPPSASAPLPPPSASAPPGKKKGKK